MENEEKQIKSTQVNLEGWEALNDDELKAQVADAGEEEREEFDASKYIGTRTKIAEWSILRSQYGPSVILRTEEIETGIKASRILNVVYHEPSNRFLWYKGSKTSLFMEEHKAKKFDDLLGKEVIIQTTIAKKDGKKYMTF